MNSEREALQYELEGPFAENFGADEYLGEDEWPSEEVKPLAADAQSSGEAFDGYEPTGEQQGNESLTWLDIEAPFSGESYDPNTAESYDPAGEAEAFDGNESEGLGSPALSTLEAMLEAEAGIGTSLADRVKGVASFVAGPTLRRGAAGPGVAALQRALGSLGIDIAVDGTFGANTERAVRAFQSRSGLAADGVVEARTKAAIHLRSTASTNCDGTEAHPNSSISCAGSIAPMRAAPRAEAPSSATYPTRTSRPSRARSCGG
jgi:hypothetical protein